MNSVKSGSVVSTYTQGTHSLLPLEFQGKVVLQWPRHDNRIFPRKSTARAEAYYIDPSIQSCVTSDFGLLVHLCGLQRPLISIKFGGRVLQLPYPKNAHTQDSERFSFSSYAGSSALSRFKHIASIICTVSCTCFRCQDTILGQRYTAWCPL